jgi:WD40 repeat protein
MSTETAIAKDSGKEKQKKANIRIEWIFGIRNDMIPNIYMLDTDTVVYPASAYVVILNISKKLPQNQQQKFITGTPHSLGFKSIATYNSHKRYIAVSEELQEGALVSIYVINNQQGQFNVPVKIGFADLTTDRITKVFHLAFSQRDLTENYFAAVGICGAEAQIIYWKWDQDSIRDKCIRALSLPSQKFKFLNISFSIFKNDIFYIISDLYVQSYSISGKMINFTGKYEQLTGSILQYAWFIDGNFCITTNESIVILDPTFKILQNISTYDSVNKTFITCVLPSLEGERFIACGTNKRFDIYERRKSETYERILSKTFEDKNDKEKAEKDNKNFDFHSLSTINGISEEFILATTSNNDLIQIKQKDIEKQFNFKHLISQFHSDSIEGMDIAVNKPYIISCSKDKSLKVWDYKNRCLALSKTFEEEMYSVAYHPSGMHCIVSFEEKIIPMNIYYDEISNMTQNGIQARKSKDVNKYFISFFLYFIFYILLPTIYFYISF